MSELNIIVKVINKKINKGTYSTFESGVYTVSPYMVSRRSCGEGKAAKRYYYTAHFVGFGDMIDIHGNSAVGVKCMENIVRTMNKGFKPRSLVFVDDMALVNKGA